MLVALPGSGGQRVRSVTDSLSLLVLVLATAWAGTRAARLELDVENRSMRSRNSPEARVEADRERLFGQDATLVLLLEPRPDPGALEPGAGEPDSVEDSLVEEPLETWAAGLEALPEVDRFLRLGDDDPEERLVALTLASDAALGPGRSLEAVVRAAERTTPASHRLWVSGSPMGEAAIAAALDQEQRRMVPLVGGVLFVLLLLVYRSFWLALGSLFPALAGIAWTGALQDGLGHPVNPVTALLPPVLLAVGVAGSVHLIEAYLEARAGGQAPERASRSAVRAIRVPAIGCAATTLAGFLALCMSPIPAIDRFGLLAAVGVLVTALFTFAALPPWLRRFARSERMIRRAAGHGPWRWLSAWLACRLARFTRPITVLTVGVALFLGWQWTRLTVDTDPLRILPARHAFRQATDRIGARLGGTETFDLLLEPPGPDGGFVSLLGLQQAVLALDGVAGPGGPPRRNANGTGLITALLEPAGSAAREQTFAAAEGLARERGWERAHASGTAVRVARDSGAIVRGEIYGLLATFLALGPCIAFGLRSLRLTRLCLAANTLPCLLLHGGLATVGRPLSVASAMISSVVLGLVVDNAIYLLHGYRAARTRARPRLAVARTLQGSGRALTVTSLILALGFLAGLSGELSTTREFGVLASSSVLAAWIANVLVLPTLLLRTRSSRPIPDPSLALTSSGRGEPGPRRGRP